jgi:hypothetical protein
VATGGGLKRGDRIAKLLLRCLVELPQRRSVWLGGRMGSVHLTCGKEMWKLHREDTIAKAWDRRGVGSHAFKPFRCAPLLHHLHALELRRCSWSAAAEAAPEELDEVLELPGRIHVLREQVGRILSAEDLA